MSGKFMKLLGERDKDMTLVNSDYEPTKIVVDCMFNLEKATEIAEDVLLYESPREWRRYKLNKPYKGRVNVSPTEQSKFKCISELLWIFEIKEEE